MTDNVFLFRVDAVAGDGAGYKAGDRHAHLIFASGPSFEAAEAVAVAALNDKGWEFAKVLRGGEVGPEGYEGKDDVLRSAADRATANGCAIVTYATPIAPEA